MIHLTKCLGLILQRITQLRLSTECQFSPIELAALRRSIGKYESKYLQKNEDCVKPTARFPVTVFSGFQANHLAVF